MFSRTSHSRNSIYFFSVFLLDLINAYDGGIRSVYGENATSHIFTSYPHEKITKTTGFFDIVSKKILNIFYTLLLFKNGGKINTHTHTCARALPPKVIYAKECLFCLTRNIINEPRHVISNNVAF